MMDKSLSTDQQDGSSELSFAGSDDSNALASGVAQDPVHVIDPSAVVRPDYRRLDRKLVAMGAASASRKWPARFVGA